MTRLVIIGLAIAAAAMPVLAVDGAFGRSIPGTWVVPSVGVIGPDAGFSFTTFPIGYMGARGGNRLSEAFGVLLTNDEANVSINVLIPSYVWKTESQKVSFSSSFMVPVNWWGVTAEQHVNGTLNGFLQRTNSANSSVADIVAIPLTVGIHFSNNNNLAFSAWVWTPTGLFQPGNISSVGMGVWTVMPNFAHTYFWEKRNLEFDNFVGFDIYGHNAATNYTSGTVFHWDGMALQYFGKKRFGIGAIGSNITQITDDRGPLADELNGFAGRKWGVGPMILYTAKRDNPGMSFQLRWINEFKVTNMLKGNTFMAGVSLRVK